jgi:hypothetical protein
MNEDRPDPAPSADSTAATEPPNNIISLSQFRSRVARGRRENRIDALMNLPNPEQAIRALPGDELYYLLRESDPQDGTELLAYARPEQIQVVLDFGLWTGDHLSPDRLDEWVDVMAAMSIETAESWIKGLDVELVALLIRKGARVYDLEIDPPPDEPVGTFYPTPDGLFVLDVIGYQPIAEDEYDGSDPETTSEGAPPATSTRALIQIIDNLYRADLNFARHILVAVKAELDSELEEMAFRWRQGRMEDLGFIDAYKALEVYRELDPASVRIGELRPGTRVRSAGWDDAADYSLRMPAALAAELGGASLFARSLARVTSPDELKELRAGLVTLTNRVLAAARVSPADDEAVSAQLTRMRCTLDLGVEYLARKDGVLDEERAIDAVRTVALPRLFRLGVSLCGKLRALARALSRNGPFAGLPGIDLVEDPEATVLGAVNRGQPMYPRLLDDPPANGERPFAALADLARATAALERAAGAQAMLLGLGVRPAHLTREARSGTLPGDPAEIDTGVLARTALVLALAEAEAAPAGVPRRPTAFRPLTATEHARFQQMHPVPEALLRRARLILEQVFPARMPLAAAEMADRWVATLSPLEPALVRPAGRKAAPAPRAAASASRQAPPAGRKADPKRKPRRP